MGGDLVYANNLTTSILSSAASDFLALDLILFVMDSTAVVTCLKITQELLPALRFHCSVCFKLWKHGNSIHTTQMCTALRGYELNALGNAISKF